MMRVGTLLLVKRLPGPSSNQHFFTLAPARCSDRSRSRTVPEPPRRMIEQSWSSIVLFALAALEARVIHRLSYLSLALCPLGQHALFTHCSTIGCQITTVRTHNIRTFTRQPQKPLRRD